MERIIDPKGNISHYSYNEAGELIKTEDGLGRETIYGYTSLGQLSYKINTEGKKTSYVYAQGGRLEKLYTSVGEEIKFSYDTLGRLKEMEGKYRGKTTYEYDAMSRIVGVTAAKGQRSGYTYDALGQITSITDAKGNQTSYSYTPTGKLKEVVNALGDATIYGYDERDFLTRICRKGQEEERILQYTYNAFGEVTGMQDALGYGEKYSYDGLGRIVEKVDREGLTVRYSYSPLGQVEHILYGDGKEVSYTYDALGQLERMKDWLGETTIERNDQGKPVQIRDHRNRIVEYKWGSQGEQKAMVYPDGTTLQWEYDELLRPIQWIRREEGKPDIRVDYAYDEAGRLISKKSNGGYLTRLAYDGSGQLHSLTHEDGRGILEEYVYGYDELGNKTRIKKSRTGLPLESGEYRYTYDGLQRLTEVMKDGKLLRDYSYDAFGNRIQMKDRERGIVNICHYNQMDQLIGEEIQPLAGGESMPQTGQEGNGLFQGGYLFKEYSYDQRGNLIQERGKEGEPEKGWKESLLHSYTYDARNQLERAWNHEGEEAAYVYNGMGQRVEKKTHTGQEEYILDFTKPYHNLLGIQREGETECFYWDFTTIATESKGAPPRYYLQDELGSPLRVQYGTGKGEVYGYDEFGQDLAEGKQPALTGETARPYTRQGTTQPFGYTGYRYDGISGSYFAQTREYQPRMGRFMAEDMARESIFMPKTLNRYGYCWGNPLLLVDLDGRFPSLSDMGKGITDTINGVKDAVSDAAEVVVEAVSHAAEEVRETMVGFYQENKEVIDTLWKLGLTLGIGAAIMRVAIAVGIPGAVVAGGGVVGGVVGGFSNMTTGGSFINGFCGGAINGCITAFIAGTGGILERFIGNFAGGFVGNMITENLNNLDAVTPDQMKEQEAIIVTSMVMGFTQGATALLLPIDVWLKRLGITEKSLAHKIAGWFGQSISYSSSTSVYIPVDWHLRKKKNNALQRSVLCAIEK